MTKPQIAYLTIEILDCRLNNVSLSISRLNLLGRSFRRLAGRGVYCDAVLQGANRKGEDVTFVMYTRWKQV